MKMDIKMLKIKTLIRIALFVLLIGCSTKLSAQFDGHFSLFHLTKTFYNPAAVGSQELMKVQVAQRLQTIEIKNSPKTTFFTVNTPFKIKNTNHAAGIEFVNDMFGIFANQQINLQYAYRHKFKNLTLSVGANVGIINIICYGDSINIVESEYHTPANNDPAFPIGTQSGVGFDLGLGVYLQGNNWNAGIGVKHIPGSKVNLGERYSFKTTQLYSISGQYDITIPSNKKYKISPAAIVYTDMRSFQFQVSAMLNYDSKYWGGIAYSLQNAVSFMVGAEIINGLDVAYCYDLPASEFIRVTHGSHELSLSYEFNIMRNKTTNKHKSIRIL